MIKNLKDFDLDLWSIKGKGFDPTILCNLYYSLFLYCALYSRLPVSPNLNLKTTISLLSWSFLLGSLTRIHTKSDCWVASLPPGGQPQAARWWATRRVTDDYVAFGVNPELTSNTSIKVYPGTNILIIEKPTTWLVWCWHWSFLNCFSLQASGYVETSRRSRAGASWWFRRGLKVRKGR